MLLHLRLYNDASFKKEKPEQLSVWLIVYITCWLNSVYFASLQNIIANFHIIYTLSIVVCAQIECSLVPSADKFSFSLLFGRNLRFFDLYIFAVAWRLFVNKQNCRRNIWHDAKCDWVTLKLIFIC